MHRAYVNPSIYLSCDNSDVNDHALGKNMGTFGEKKCIFPKMFPFFLKMEKKWGKYKFSHDFSQCGRINVMISL